MLGQTSQEGGPTLTRIWLVAKMITITSMATSVMRLIESSSPFRNIVGSEVMEDSNPKPTQIEYMTLKERLRMQVG